VPRFLLVSLTIGAILAEATIHKRRERLDIMTSGLGLDGAYDATLDRIKGHGGGRSVLGKAALMWIAHSQRPMRVGELCEALGVEIGSRHMKCDNIPSEKTLLASCLGLVTVDESSIVHLVHSTLQEYLNRHPEHFVNPQSIMTEVCLTYLNFDSVNLLSHTLETAPVETPLLQYASSYWGFYASNGLTETAKSLALQLLDKFGAHISAKLLFRGKFSWWERETRHSEGFTGLHCAAYLGLGEVALALLEMMKGCGIDLLDGSGRTPLTWAAESGHERIVKLLLDQKEVNPDSKDNYGRTPLWCAARGGHEEIVKLLLDRREVNPDSRDGNGQTPLWRAAKGGHEGIVKLLLNRKEANPELRDDDGQTPLRCAAKGGYEGIVKLLLDQKEVNPDSRDNYGRTPLWCAANSGHEGVVKLLLERQEVNPDMRDDDGQTPLQCAAKGGHEAIVKLFLDRKEVNPNSKDNCGRTPVWCAVGGGYEGIMKLLLNQSTVNPDSRDIEGQTPLWRAAKGGHKGIVKLLLNRKEVNPDSKDNNGRTPLWCAARGGHKEIVKLLLDRKEVNPDSSDNSGRTPLWCASRGGHEQILKLLGGRVNTESGTNANNALIPPFYLAEDDHWGDIFGQLPLKPDGLAIDMSTQDEDTDRISLPAGSPPDTPQSSQGSGQGFGYPDFTFEPSILNVDDSTARVQEASTNVNDALIPLFNLVEDDHWADDFLRLFELQPDGLAIDMPTQHEDTDRISLPAGPPPDTPQSSEGSGQGSGYSDLIIEPFILDANDSTAQVQEVNTNANDALILPFNLVEDDHWADIISLPPCLTF